MTKDEELQEAERQVLALVEKWFDSDYMAVRVTHRDLIELVHATELNLYDAVHDMQILRKQRDAAKQGDKS